MTSEWRPHKGAQEAFCQRAEFEALYGGAAGPGKTDCLVALASRLVDRPGYRAILFRRTFPRLQEIMDRCWEHYPTIGGEWKATERRWYFPGGDASGSVKPFVQLGHMQHEDDKRDYQGKEFAWAGFDEVTEFSEDQYLFLVGSRVRSKHADISPRVRCTTNPGGIGHKWVKERFIDRAKPGQTYIDPETGLSRIFIPGRLEDNPTLLEADPGYIARLSTLPEIEKKRLLYGDWDIFEGQVFPELGAAHRIEPFDIPPDWERYMAFDWGFAHPFSVGWYAVDYDGVLYRYREWYGCKEGCRDQGLRMVAREVAQGILDREDPKEKIKARIADPKIFDKLPAFRQKEVIGTTIADDMQAEGLFFLKANNSRIQGKLQIHKRLQMVEDVNEETGELLTQRPMFYAFSDQEAFWRTVPELQHDPNNMEDIDTKMEDHVVDEWRYICMFRPILPKRRIHGPPVGSFQHERKKLIRAKKFANSHGMSLTEAYAKIR